MDVCRKASYKKVPLTECKWKRLRTKRWRQSWNTQKAPFIKGSSSTIIPRTNAYTSLSLLNYFLN